jgi:hypothetical protein
MHSFSSISHIAAALAIGLTATPVFALDNPNFNLGDLVLFFQQEGGGNTVYANLGNAATAFRGAAAGADAPNRVNFMNVGTALTTAFGPGWASDATVYAGLAAVWGTSPTSNLLRDGDPHRTLYVSAKRDAVGAAGSPESAQWLIGGNTQMSAGSNLIVSQNNVLETNYLNEVVVSPTIISKIDDCNPFLESGIQGLAMGAFDGGIQQRGTTGSFGTMGPAGNVEFALDLYRILAKTGISGQVAGILREGSFEGTVTVNASGQVSFIAQGATPVSSYATWINGSSPPLTNANDKLANADPDNDGLINLMEFVLNGSPSVSDSAIAPTLNTSGTDFVFTFNRRDDSEAGSTLLFQYSADLTSWTDVTVGASSGVVGAATLGVTENATAPDAISVSVPKTVAPGGKLFGRLKASQP